MTICKVCPDTLRECIHLRSVFCIPFYIYIFFFFFFWVVQFFSALAEKKKTSSQRESALAQTR
jgi:hypothetical protein